MIGNTFWIERFGDNHIRSAFFLRNNKEIWKWCRQCRPLSWQEHQRWYDSLASDPKNIMFALMKHGSLIGVCGLTNIDRINQHAELSLYIDSTEQRKGHGTTAMKFLINQAFNFENLNHLWVEPYDNSPAIPFIHSLNFSYEGTRNQFYYRNGAFIDAHLFSLTKKDYNDRSNSDS